MIATPAMALDPAEIDGKFSERTLASRGVTPDLVDDDLASLVDGMCTQPLA